MFRHPIIFAILLSLNPALGTSNERPVAVHVYDEEQLNKIQHQIELLNSANENLRLRMDISNDRMDRLQAEISIEIKSVMSAISNEMNSRLSGLVNETNSRLNGFANEIHSLGGLASETNKRLNGLANETNSGLRAIANEITEIKKITNSDNEKRKKADYPTSCLKLAGGLQLIQIDRFIPDPFVVYCDNLTHGGGWTVVERRMDGSVDFFRNWADYRRGFGNLEKEFFIGLDKLHALTMPSANELLIVMRDKDDVERFAKYESFVIGDDNEHYAINVLGEYSGDAGDALQYVQSGRFCTKDNDGPNTCAERYTGAWWEKDGGCYSSLNGKYGDDTVGKGINWAPFHGFRYSLPYVQMMIRPKRQ